ncbi:unnamed protein product [Trichogramma brassicae]|uniref:Uncharacterized protein n=1 Tax=Trichogramma brassicae TaxID=86971 RepID=A0A6H5IEC6_9HYME|nr:unnamed protein product [Trichogramma brassicae]
MDENDQECLKKLKSMRKEVNWEVEKERHKLLDQLYPLVRNWKGQLPDVREIFQQEEIDWLLLHYMSNIIEYPDCGILRTRIVTFFTKAGYKDKPNVDQDGKPLLRRTTAVHRAAGEGRFTPSLFKIYDRFDLNYIDERGITHFHVACEYGCCDVVEKFLELGQDPDCLAQKSDSSPIDSPLHLALDQKEYKMVALLLRNGANPNSFNNNGLVPLHIICMREKNSDVDLYSIFCKRKTVPDDDWDKLDVAILLLRSGANPNLASKEGLTPLHMICERSYVKDLTEVIFEISADENQTLQVDARDKFGRTPLQLAVANLMPDLVKLLLDRGADLSGVVLPNETYFDSKYRGNKDTVNDHRWQAEPPQWEARGRQPHAQNGQPRLILVAASTPTLGRESVKIHYRNDPVKYDLVFPLRLTPSLSRELCFFSCEYRLKKVSKPRTGEIVNYSSA